MKFRKILSLLCVLALAVGLLGAFAVSSGAAEKKVTKRTIAIVFDNSGSMFYSGNMAWCQAQYAMEVFASMMNDGDTLMIYPMWPISVGNGAARYSFQNKTPMIVPKDAKPSDIRNIQTHHDPSDGTPIESIDVAHDGLAAASGDEKWLIVLTDGEIFEANGKNLSAANTKKELEKRLGQYVNDVNVMYLGIGTKLDKPSVSGANTYIAETASSANVPAMLTRMCNTIFGRDELPKANYTSNSIDFDLPLSKLYVFVQGKDIGSVKISGGGKVYKELSSYQPKYGEYGSSGCAINAKLCAAFKPDTSLQGYIAVYSDLPAGKYDFSCVGNPSSVAFYYEPDADLKISLIDADGKTVNSPEEVTKGDYYLQYALVDKNGKELRSSLLGNVNYEIKYTLNGKEETINRSESGQERIPMEIGVPFKVNSATGTYLKDYTTTKEGKDFGFLFEGVTPIPNPAKPLGINVSGGTESYDADRLATDALYHVALTYDGQPLHGDGLTNVTLDAETNCAGLTCTVNRTENGFDVQVDAPSDLAQLKEGDYTLTLSATRTSETELTATASQEIPFHLNIVLSKLEVVIDDSEDYFVISDLKEGESIEVQVLLDGQPLTEEQMQQVEFSATAEGLPLVFERIPGKSAFSVHLEPGAEPQCGHYTLSAYASGVTDRMGQQLAAETATFDFGVHLISEALLWLIILLAILLVIIAILLIRRIPMLPGKIECEEGSTVKLKKTEMDKIVCRRQKNTLRIDAMVGNQEIGVGINIKPAKGSVLGKKSSKRQCQFTLSDIDPDSAIQSLYIASSDFSVKKGVLKSASDDPEEIFVLGNGDSFEFKGKTHFNGEEKGYKASGTVVFK